MAGRLAIAASFTSAPTSGQPIDGTDEVIE